MRMWPIRIMVAGLPVATKKVMISSLQFTRDDALPADIYQEPPALPFR